MRILVVSHVFPGEFGQLAAALAAAGHEVVFAAAHGRREARIPGVRHLDLRDAPLRRLQEAEEDPYGVALAGRLLDRAAARARDAARRLARLRAAGWEPQILCCSAAHGNGMLARGLFPQAFLWSMANGTPRRTRQPSPPRPWATFCRQRPWAKATWPLPPQTGSAPATPIFWPSGWKSGPAAWTRVFFLPGPPAPPPRRKS